MRLPLDDVKDWFKTYYGPNNAVVVISGDVKADDIFEKVKNILAKYPPAHRSLIIKTG